ncbi:hypothetical protein [Vibrio cholerae]
MEMNDLNAQGNNNQKFSSSLSESLFFKHYLISLFLWIAIVIFNVFSDRRDAVEIGFWMGLGMIILVPPFTALGSYVGRKFRDFTKPDFIMTSGAAETFKAKLFWKFGPQVIGWFVAAMIVSNIVDKA